MPHYPLQKIKELIRNNRYDIRLNALESAYNDFNWGESEIAKCILRLNGRLHTADRENNHFYKSEPHYHLPYTVMDYYKAKYILRGFSVYTHFYIHPNSGRLIISSFKEL